MTKEQKFLQSWTPDYTNEKGETFYESGKVAVILSEYAQIKDNDIEMHIETDESGLYKTNLPIIKRIKTK